MNNDVFTIDLYNKINSLKVPHAISTELKNYSPEFISQYRKYGFMLRNKKFRDNNKEAINAKRRQSRAILRDSIIKPIETIKTTIDPEAVDTTAKRLYKASMKITQLNPNSINNYINSIKTIYSKYHNHTLPEDAEILKLLNNVKYCPKKLLKQNIYIVHNIKDIALNYPSSISSLNSIFSRLSGKNLNILRETLYPYKLEYLKVYEENRDKAVLNTDLTSKISFDYNDVISNSNNIPDLYDKIIYLLLFLIPTRRLYDYRITRIATKKTDTDNLAFNWYFQGSIYINNTKNKDSMIIPLPPDITELINSLPPDTDYLLGKSYSEPVLSKKFAKITNHIYGNPFNALDIRKLYASHNLKTAALSGDTNKFKDNARNMGHSVEQSLSYVVKS